MQIAIGVSIIVVAVVGYVWWYVNWLPGLGTWLTRHFRRKDTDDAQR